MLLWIALCVCFVFFGIYSQERMKESEHLCISWGMLCAHSVVFDSLATPWIVPHQAPLFMAFSRQEYWSGLPFPSPGDLPDPRIEPMSPALAGRIFTTEPPGKPHRLMCTAKIVSKSIEETLPASLQLHQLCHPSHCGWAAQLRGAMRIGQKDGKITHPPPPHLQMLRLGTFFVAFGAQPSLRDLG